MKLFSVATLGIIICLLSTFPFVNGCKSGDGSNRSKIFYPVSITNEMRSGDEIEIVIKSENGGTLLISLDNVENVYRASMPWKVTTTLSDVNKNEEIRERTLTDKELYWVAVGRGNTFCYIAILCGEFPFGEITCKLRFNEPMLNAIKDGSVKLVLHHYTEAEKRDCLSKKIPGYTLRPSEKK